METNPENLRTLADGIEDSLKHRRHLVIGDADWRIVIDALRLTACTSSHTASAEQLADALEKVLFEDSDKTETAKLSDRLKARHVLQCYREETAPPPPVWTQLGTLDLRFDDVAQSLQNAVRPNIVRLRDSAVRPLIVRPRKDAVADKTDKEADTAVAQRRKQKWDT